MTLISPDNDLALMAVLFVIAGALCHFISIAGYAF